MARYKKLFVICMIFFMQFSLVHRSYAMSWNDVKATATAAGAAATGSSTVGGATRTAAATVPWGSIKNGLGKGLRGGGNLLLGAAIYAALSATDYVLDPANNSVIYKKNQSVALDDTSPTYPSAWHWANIGYYSSASSACSAALLYDQQTYPSYNSSKFSLVFNSDTSASCYIYDSYGTLKNIYTVGYTSNPNFDSTAPAEQDQTKTISIPDLLQLLIDQMNNNDAAIKNVLDQILESSIAQAQTATNIDADLKAMLAAITAALDKNATYPVVGTATGTTTNTATGTDLKLDFPAFCGWAGIVCEAAQTAINFPNTVTQWWQILVGWWGTITSWHDAFWVYVEEKYTAVKDWATTEPDNSDTELDLPDPPTQTFNSDISFSQQCPAPIVLANFSYHGIQQNWQVDFSQWCDLITTYIRPIVIAMGAFSAVLIVAGVRDNG